MLLQINVSSEFILGTAFAIISVLFGLWVTSLRSDNKDLKDRIKDLEDKYNRLKDEDIRRVEGNLNLIKDRLLDEMRELNVTLAGIRGSIPNR
jgi:hypothetical protein